MVSGENVLTIKWFSYRSTGSSFQWLSLRWLTNKKMTTDNQQKGFLTNLKIGSNHFMFLGNIWSFRNKEKGATADIIGEVTTVPLVCNNWLQSGCPLNNNMVIHQCALNNNNNNNSISNEDNPKQDQVRGLLVILNWKWCVFTI